MKKKKQLEMDKLGEIKKMEQINPKTRNQDSIYSKDFYQNILIVNGAMLNSRCQVMIIARDRHVHLIKKAHN